MGQAAAPGFAYLMPQDVLPYDSPALQRAVRFLDFLSDTEF
ncbi:MAG: hypothetical protein U5R06_11905 [candidate division KSB1 bacterium]|nr:hypothetical protein [candidate division KSB1 bacterium]